MFRDVATIVTEKSINTETERPYTITMIQNAMKDIHYSVSLTKNAKQQALDVIRKLRKVMPIARLLMSLRITLQASCNYYIFLKFIIHFITVSHNYSFLLF